MVERTENRKNSNFPALEPALGSLMRGAGSFILACSLVACMDLSKNRATLEQMGHILSPGLVINEENQDPLISGETVQGFELYGRCSSAGSRVVIVQPEVKQLSGETEVICDSNNLWQMKLDLSSLPDQKFQFVVRMIRESDGVTVDATSMRYKKLTHSPIAQVDTTAPGGFNPAVSATGRVIRIYWVPVFDAAGDPVEGYRVSVSDSAPGSADLIPWFDNGSGNYADITLPDSFGSDGQLVYINIQSVDQTGATGNIVSTPPIVYDSTPPTFSSTYTSSVPWPGLVPSVSVGPSITWQVGSSVLSDSASGVSHFVYQVKNYGTGEIIRGETVLPLTATGSSQTFTPSGLSLIPGETYQFDLQAVDNAGNKSTPPLSVRWVVDPALAAAPTPSPTPSPSPSVSPTPSPSPSASSSPALALVFLTQPSDNAVAGQAFARQPVVQVQDGSSTPVTSLSGTASVGLSVYQDSACNTPVASPALSGGSANVSGSTANFSAALLDETVGSFYLKAEVTGTTEPVTPVCSAAVSVTGLLSISNLPSSVIVGATFTSAPRVTLQNQGGTTLSALSSSVQVTAYPGTDSTCSGATATGSLSNSSMSATSGTADFGSMSFDTVGSIRLKASSPGFATVCSPSISVVPAYSAPSGFCTSGTLDTTCTVSVSKVLADSASNSIVVNNLVVTNNSIITAYSNNTNQGCLLISASGTVTVNAGSKIISDAKGYSTVVSVTRNPWEPMEWGSGISASSRGGGCIRIAAAGNIVVNGSITSLGGSASSSAGSQGGSVWLKTSGAVTGTGALSANGGAGDSGASNSGGCYSNPGKAGGNGGAIKIDGLNTGFTGTATAAGGAGGSAGLTKFGCSSVSGGGNGAAGTAGTVVRFNQRDLVVSSGLNISVSSALAATLDTIEVASGGTLTVPSGVSLSLTSFTTRATSMTSNSGTITAGTVLLNGGSFINTAGQGTLTASTSASVTAASSYRGELTVNGALSVSAKLSSSTSNPAVTLVINAASVGIVAGGQISGDSAAANATSGGVVEMNVTGNLNLAGSITSLGSTGAAGGTVSLDVGTLTGGGLISVKGGDGAQGNNSTSGAAYCNNGPGSAGGNGGLIEIRGDRSGFTGTTNVSGGLGGLPGNVGSSCSSPNYSGRAASGVTGSLVYY